MNLFYKWIMWHFVHCQIQKKILNYKVSSLHFTDPKKKMLPASRLSLNKNFKWNREEFVLFVLLSYSLIATFWFTTSLVTISKQLALSSSTKRFIAHVPKQKYCIAYDRNLWASYDKYEVTFLFISVWAPNRPGNSSR